MVSRPLLRFLLAIDLYRYVGTCLGTEGASDATFRFLHVNNVVSASVILGRIGQHVLRTEGDTQPAALTSFSVNYYDSFWHVWALSESMSRG
jgi:hypothetical protein